MSVRQALEAHLHSHRQGLERHPEIHHVHPSSLLPPNHSFGAANRLESVKEGGTKKLDDGPHSAGGGRGRSEERNVHGGCLVHALVVAYAAPAAALTLL